MKKFLVLVSVSLAICASAQIQSHAPITSGDSEKFAGAWWLKADVEERSGFLNGTADCLTWTAHKEGFNATPEQLSDKISKFYVAHPESVSLSIIDVWQKVTDNPKVSKGADRQGERWKNAHWYLNGDWWSQVSEAQQLGFVEGYLWCLKTQASTPTDSYSASASLYRRKIDAFVRANPKLGKEAVAITLRRYRDKDAVPAPK
jgi:hypothetical protein